MMPNGQTLELFPIGYVILYRNPAKQDIIEVKDIGLDIADVGREVARTLRLLADDYQLRNSALQYASLSDIAWKVKMEVRTYTKGKPFSTIYLSVYDVGKLVTMAEGDVFSFPPYEKEPIPEILEQKIVDNFVFYESEHPVQFVMPSGLSARGSRGEGRGWWGNHPGHRIAAKLGRFRRYGG